MILPLWAWHFLFSISYTLVGTTQRYYGGYTVYGSGDTIISAFHNEGGTTLPHRKWIVECMDGEALVGLQDFFDDFERLQMVWCKFMFPYKPPSHGKYPYYPSCVVRNYTDTYFCLNAKDISASINTFVTALWDNEFNFYQFRVGGYNSIQGDDLQPFKCCKTPQGYYIDYVSCYYVATHDLYYEFYDSNQWFMVFCGTSYVMTGISKKKTPFEQEYHLDWIQCCRLGYGFPMALSPPVIRQPDGRQTFYAYSAHDTSPLPDAFAGQYAVSSAAVPPLAVDMEYNTSTPARMAHNDQHAFRYNNNRQLPISVISQRMLGNPYVHVRTPHDAAIHSRF
ncbi:uncharacterized protein LOC129583336 isoform X2 [Paramacrobiotus metropolitanus]|uniref:uncharacterized protein LOC129583336 isoform X2 n=1 Tax=Paramacrobiotus metropolitanus TaxID=2943436 RepID=UPI00244646E3|nr:uncharacterized protein LOC129583336 isoform X2 [Paramacrobiotus metropolitanus]